MPIKGSGSTAFLAITALAAVLARSPAAQGVEVYRLTATNVAITQPAPLFSTHLITGTLTLPDSVAPGASFGAASLLDATLNFGGIVGGLAAIKADVAPGPVQIFGTRSADGLSLSMLDFRFGFSTATPGCSLACAGQIIINSGFDPSNFIAIDDPLTNTLSSIDSFTPSFALMVIPEPTGLGVLAFGLLGLSRLRRTRRA